MTSKPFRLSFLWLKKITQYLLLGLLLPVLSIFPTAGLGRGAAQDLALTISQNQATLNFPDSIQFSLSVSSASTIQNVALIYGTSAQSCVSSSARQELDFTASKSEQLSWTWDLRQTEDLPPGAGVWWQWEVQDDSGQSYTSPAKQITIQDPNFKWQKLQSGVLTVYWSKGNAAFGKMLLDTALNGLARLTKSAGVQPPDQIQLTIYPSADAMKKAAPALPEWTGGVAFTDYNSVLIGIAPGEDDWAAQVIPHELAHLVTNKRIQNCQGNDIPTWLNEGISVFNQGPTTQNDKDLVQRALRSNNLPPFTGLTDGFSADTNMASLEYAESGMLVTFMIEKLGANKLDALLGAVQQGDPINTALQKVYGLDTAALDQTWRASLGYGVAPTPAAFQPSPTAHTTTIPTLALWSPLALTPSVTLGPGQTVTPQPTATALQPSGQNPAAPSAPSAQDTSTIRSFIILGLAFMIVLGLLVILLVIYLYRSMK